MAFHGKGSAVTQDSQSFGVRLDAQTLERLDAYAGRAARKRGWAAARAIAAGLDALDGVAAPPPSPGSNPAPSAGTPEANDARALAGGAVRHARAAARRCRSRRGSVGASAPRLRLWA